MRFVGCSAAYIDRKKLKLDNCHAIELPDAFHFKLKPKSVRRCREEIESNLPNVKRIIWTAWHVLTHPIGELPVDKKFKAKEGEDIRAFGYFKPSLENENAWRAIQSQVEQVGATDLLFKTPVSFSPSSSNINHIVQFMKNAAKQLPEVHFIWQPEGLWQREQCLELVDEMGISLAIDPLVDTKAALPTSDKYVYFKLLGRHGLRDRYSDDDLLELLDICDNFEHVTLVFKTAQPMKDVERFETLASLSF